MNLAIDTQELIDKQAQIIREQEQQIEVLKRQLRVRYENSVKQARRWYDLADWIEANPVVNSQTLTQEIRRIAGGQY